MPNELNLNNQKIDVLVVKIEDKEYKIPLATSLPYKEVKTLIGLQKNNRKDCELLYLRGDGGCGGCGC